MLKAIKDFFESSLDPNNQALGQSRDRCLQLTTAALLIELVHADLEAPDSEWLSVEKSLRDTFNLKEQELQEVIRLAKVDVKKSTDLFQFTRLINEHYSYPDKCTLLQNMWKVAYADGRIDRFEEHLIRKIAGLIYVDHADFIEAKQLSRR